MTQKLVQVSLDKELVDAVDEYIKKNNDNPLKPKITKTSLIADLFIKLATEKQE